jgi:hypothetical protein
VGLTSDVVPKLTVNFKAKRERQVLEQFKPKKVDNEKTSQ